MKNNMTKIKICGLTSGEEAAYLNEAGADAAGFIQFFPKSRRNIATGEARKIMCLLAPSIRKAAVTVSPTPDQIREIERAGFDYLQVHGDISDELLRSVRIPVIRAFNGSTFSTWKHYMDFDNVAGLLFDAGVPGSGKTFDWSALSGIDTGEKLKILAGGLNPDNVCEAVRTVRPDYVDVSTGVERDQGRGKSREKILRFVSEARRA